jgi:hypothetical protein
MRRIAIIILLGFLGAVPAQAQYAQRSGETGVGRPGSERYSPHYYTVRNILRNHRYLKPSTPPMASALLPAVRISLSDVELESDVVFRGGAYDFRARLAGTPREVRLRKRDGDWILEVRDEMEDRVLGTYVLER